MLQTEYENLFGNVFPFWNSLTASQQQRLSSSTSYRSYHKGQNIHGGSESCTGAVLVNKGSIRAYLLSDEGKEITLYRLSAGEICMLSASCVLQSITFDVFVDAEEDTECYILSGETFADIAQENIYAKNYALNMAVGRFSDVVWAMQQILFMSFDRRLAIFLLQELKKADTPLISLTQEQIAKYMGSAREVVSRMLKYFASEGIAESVRGGVKILDIEKLRALA